jgi:hypothetical protein
MQPLFRVTDHRDPPPSVRVEFVFVAPRLSHDVGFEEFQPPGSDGYNAVEENGFIYESLYLNFGDRNESRLSFPAGSLGRTCSRVARHLVLPTW